jgi:hypothetical protein
MNHGILGDPARWEELSRRPANNDWLLERDDPIRVAIEETNSCCEIEALRIHLAHALRGIFDDDLEAQNNRLLALPDRQMRAFKQHFAHFKAWCHDEGLPSLPTVPEVIAHYLVDGAAKDIKAKQLEQIVEAIRWVHQLADMGQRRLPGYCDFDAPVIRAALVWVQRCWDEEEAEVNARVNERVNSVQVKPSKQTKKGKTS